MAFRKEIEKYMRQEVCPSCNGDRLKKEAIGKDFEEISKQVVQSLKKARVLSV